MNRVQVLAFAPHRCAVTLRADDPDGFVDTGTVLHGWDPQVYVSYQGFKHLCKAFDSPTREEATVLREEVTVLRAEVDRLTAELGEERRVTDAIDVLESKDFRARRKPGRPKTKEPA